MTVPSRLVASVQGFGNVAQHACRRFVALCRDLKLFSQALVAIDGSIFKAVNARDKNFTAGKIDKRQQQIEESIHRYLDAMETADRTQPAELQAVFARGAHTAVLHAAAQMLSRCSRSIPKRSSGWRASSARRAGPRHHPPAIAAALVGMFE